MIVCQSIAGVVNRALNTGRNIAAAIPDCMKVSRSIAAAFHWLWQSFCNALADVQLLLHPICTCYGNVQGGGTVCRNQAAGVMGFGHEPFFCFFTLLLFISYFFLCVFFAMGT
jgi:hypothetical protein